MYFTQQLGNLRYAFLRGPLRKLARYSRRTPRLRPWRGHGQDTNVIQDLLAECSLKSYICNKVVKNNCRMDSLGYYRLE